MIKTYKKNNSLVLQDYFDVNNYLVARYDEVNGYEFYRDIFPNNEVTGEQNTDYSKPNAVYLYQDMDFEPTEDRQRLLSRKIMLNDTWKQDYMDFVECNPMTLCSGLSYRGKYNRLQNAQRMHALVFDLDGVGLDEIESLFIRIGKSHTMIRTLPIPTYVVSSGTGLHLYYVLDEPIDLFPNIKLQLKALKYDLTYKIWDYKATSKEKEIQYQSINQGFRMVGSINAKYDVEVKAYKTGNRVSLNTLNDYVIHDKNKVDINKRFNTSKMSLEEAKIKFPEWYEEVIVKGNVGLKKWNIGYRKKTGVKDYALYNWWLAKADEIKAGHRYFYMMCLVIYACKCDVSRERLESDLDDVFEILKGIEHKNPLTKEDISSALETYDKGYYNFTINDIEHLTNVRIERNKRNGRKQYVHLKIARATRDVLNENWREGNGRPKGSGTAQSKVNEWREANPQGKKAECHRQTKLSRVTINKWWDSKECEQ
ncbi:MAG: hypothetical protein ACRCW1_05845 [Anaerotignaceae bacterium]